MTVLRQWAKGPAAERVPAALLGLLLVLAMALAGSNQGREGGILILQLLALALFPGVVWRLMRRPSGLLTWGLAGLAGYSLAVPLLQLVILPSDLWPLLPGRALAVETLHAVGSAIPPHAVSLDPAGTWSCFLWLWPAVALALGTASLDLRGRQLLIELALILLVASLALGAIQMTSTGAALFQIAPDGHRGLPIGFFANRNHQAIALVIGLPLSACLVMLWPQSGERRARMATTAHVALSGLLVTGVLATRSRAGLVLGGVALLMSLASVFWFRDLGPGRRGRRLWIGMAIAAVAVLAFQIGAGAVLERFDHMEQGEARFSTWPLIVSTAQSFQPFGSGLGTFEAIYRSVEPVHEVDPAYLNNAHNDYLELWLEAGVLFPLGLTLFLAWLLASGIRAFRDQSEQAAPARAAVIGLLILLLHSVVDYPLRTQALACLFAVLCGLLAPFPGRAGRLRAASPAHRRSPG